MRTGSLCFLSCGWTRDGSINQQETSISWAHLFFSRRLTLWTNRNPPTFSTGILPTAGHAEVCLKNSFLNWINRSLWQSRAYYWSEKQKWRTAASAKTFLVESNKACLVTVANAINDLCSEFLLVPLLNVYFLVMLVEKLFWIRKVNCNEPCRNSEKCRAGKRLKRNVCLHVQL